MNARTARTRMFLAAMIVVFLGQVLQLVVPKSIPVPHLPIWERLANLVAYPCLVVGIYQQVVGGLRNENRQAQEISQASLDQIKSLLSMFEASQRMFSSLDLPTALEHAAEGVARALDADQCGIALPVEDDPNDLALAVDHRAARVAADDVGRGDEVERRREERGVGLEFLR